MPNHDEVMADLRQLLSNFQDREYSGEIDRETLFFSDFGFVSIDAVVLGETLQNHYGQPLPFPKFLSAAAERGAEDLAVGELADFLVDSLNS